MYKKKDIYNLLYIFIFLVIASIGLNNSLGISAGAFKPPIFYTSVSGLICFIYFLLAFINGITYLIKQETLPDSIFLFPRFKGAVTIAILVTMLVYHFLVYEGPVLSVDTDIYNLITHYFVPCLVILHWLVFDKKGIYQKLDPIFWTVIPIAYFSWANVVALFNTEIPYWDGDFYPYSFIDLTKHDLSKVIFTVILLIALFIVLGYGVYKLDQKLAKQHLQA